MYYFCCFLIFCKDSASRVQYKTKGWKTFISIAEAQPILSKDKKTGSNTKRTYLFLQQEKALANESIVNLRAIFNLVFITKFANHIVRPAYAVATEFSFERQQQVAWRFHLKHLHQFCRVPLVE